MLTEVAGMVKFGDIDRRRHHERAARRSHRPVAQGDHRDARQRRPSADLHQGRARARPSSSRTSEQMARYYLPVGANIQVADGDFIEAGDVIAKIPRETTKTKDITGGLPRVAELFEARKPKDAADHLARSTASSSFGKDTKGKRKVVVTPEVDGKPRRDGQGVPDPARASTSQVHTGDCVKAGEPLMDGAANPHDILRVLGREGATSYLVDEVQEVYRLQGVKINDKHIEIIVRQMLRQVRITDAGDTDFLVGRAGREASSSRTRTSSRRQGRQARRGRAAAARHHQGLAGDRELHLGGVVPGDHQGAHRGGHPAARSTTCAASRRTSSWAASSPQARVCRPTSTSTSRSRCRSTRSKRSRTRWRIRWRSSRRTRGSGGAGLGAGLAVFRGSLLRTSS